LKNSPSDHTAIGVVQKSRLINVLNLPWRTVCVTGQHFSFPSH